MIKGKNMTNNTTEQDSSETVQKTIQLLEIESSKAVGIDPGITTVSFFTTDNISEVKTQLKQNLFQVLKANPWLTGRLIRTKGQPLLQIKYNPPSAICHCPSKLQRLRP